MVVNDGIEKLELKNIIEEKNRNFTINTNLELNENHIKRLISVYEELLVRTKSLKKHSDSQVN